MTPLEFLNEEFENVQRVLSETLRHDYGPEQTGDYYVECRSRLADIGAAIRALASTDLEAIAAQLGQLSRVATFVSLIERSRLGEFSWPFADELRRIARKLLVETHLKGHPLDPITHVVSEGQGYRIYYEPQVPVASSRRRFLVVAFPRSLKHHVLLHTLFGHEVCHTALHTAGVGRILKSEVLSALTAASPLSGTDEMNRWVTDTTAPSDVKRALALYEKRTGHPFVFTNEHRLSWLVELICDLFGLMLFGPAFFAAHRTYLQAQRPSPYEIHLNNPTHPPFAVRHKMLVRLMHLTAWEQPTTDGAQRELHAAEVEFLRFILRDSYEPWSQMFPDSALRAAMEAVRTIFAAQDDLGYVPLSGADLGELVNRLCRGVPPILARIDKAGAPVLTKVHITQTLHAGWVYWIGRQHLACSVALDFLQTNRLCDHALLQQSAINLALAPKAA